MFIKSNGQFIISGNDGTISLQTDQSQSGSLFVSDVAGREVFIEKDLRLKGHQIQHVQTSLKGMYIVRFVSVNGNMVVEKVYL